MSEVKSESKAVQNNQTEKDLKSSTSDSEISYSVLNGTVGITPAFIQPKLSEPRFSERVELVSPAHQSNSLDKYLSSGIGGY